jgi:hypothetical protein
MYFSHNVTYYYDYKNPRDFTKGKSFFTMEELIRLNQNNLTKDKPKSEKELFLEQMKKEGLSDEDISFLNDNWNPPK